MAALRLNHDSQTAAKNDADFKALLDLFGDLLAELPDVFGIDFSDTFERLETVDEMLDAAREASKAGKDPGASLGESLAAAKWLRQILTGDAKPPSQPKPVKGKKQKIKKVSGVPDELTGDLLRLVNGIEGLVHKSLKPEELQKRIDELEALKAALASKWFPRIHGCDYWDLAKALEQIRKLLRRARDAVGKGDVDKPLKDAIDVKEKLEAKLK